VTEALGAGEGWLFQANPARPDGFDIWAELRPGGRDWWLARHFAARMAPGQEGFIWVSGRGGGVLGRFVVEAEPVLMRWRPSSPLETRVGVRYTDRYEPIIGREEVHAGAPDLLVFRMPRNTNYRLSEDQWASIAALAAGRSDSEVDQAERAIAVLSGIDQGLVADAALRRAIELRAMAVAWAELEAEGWDEIVDVSSHESYDIRACRAWRADHERAALPEGRRATRLSLPQQLPTLSGVRNRRVAEGPRVRAWDPAVGPGGSRAGDRAAGGGCAGVSARFLTTVEAAGELRCHEKTVRRMIRRGELAATFVAGRYLIAPADLPTAPRSRLAPPLRAPRPARGLATQVVREMEAAAQ
jgi:excisionase family DNA binding protein